MSYTTVRVSQETKRQLDALLKTVQFDHGQSISRDQLLARLVAIAGRDPKALSADPKEAQRKHIERWLARIQRFKGEGPVTDARTIKQEYYREVDP